MYSRYSHGVPKIQIIQRYNIIIRWWNKREFGSQRDETISTNAARQLPCRWILENLGVLGHTVKWVMRSYCTLPLCYLDLEPTPSCREISNEISIIKILNTHIINNFRSKLFNLVSAECCQMFWKHSSATQVCKYLFLRSGPSNTHVYHIMNLGLTTSQIIQHAGSYGTWKPALLILI